MRNLLAAHRRMVAFTFCILLSSLALAPMVQSAEPTEPPDIKEVMKQAHKKPGELLKKVATNSATDAQKKELLKLYQALAKSTPPKGDEASWKQKTELLVAAAKAAVDGDEDAPRRLMTASNCKACHLDHK